MLYYALIPQSHHWDWHETDNEQNKTSRYPQWPRINRSRVGVESVRWCDRGMSIYIYEIFIHVIFVTIRVGLLFSRRYIKGVIWLANIFHRTEDVSCSFTWRSMQGLGVWIPAQQSTLVTVHPCVNGYLAVGGLINIAGPSGGTSLQLLRLPWLNKIIPCII